MSYKNPLLISKHIAKTDKRLNEWRKYLEEQEIIIKFCNQNIEGCKNAIESTNKIIDAYEKKLALQKKAETEFNSTDSEAN